MQIISDKKILDSYIQQYELDTLFETEMTSRMKLFHFQRGETICESAAKLDYMYFLVAGKLKVYTLHNNGKSLLLGFNNPLSVIGDLEFIKKLPVRCNVEAQTNCDLVGISFHDLYQFSYNDPTFLRFLITHLSYKLYIRSHTTSVNLLYPLENRFASYLLSVNSIDPKNEMFKTDKLTEIAMLLGTSYRHLSRIIKKFREEGIITEIKGLLILKDFDKLKQIAHGNIYE